MVATYATYLATYLASYWCAATACINSLQQQLVLLVCDGGAVNHANRRISPYHLPVADYRSGNFLMIVGGRPFFLVSKAEMAQVGNVDEYTYWALM